MTVLLRCLIFVLALCATAPGAEIEEYERWYVLELQSQRAGWMRDALSITETGNVLSEQEMVIKLARLDTNIEITFRYGTLETVDGDMIESRMRQKFGAQDLRTRYVFDAEAGDVEITTRQLGMTKTDTKPIPEGEWLTPGEVRRFVRARLLADAEELSYLTLDLSSGLNVVRIEERVLGRTTIDVMGKRVPAIERIVTQSIMPDVEMREFVDDNGLPLRSTLEFGGMELSIIASDKALATAEFDAPELMANTLVRPSRIIDNPRASRRATYVLRTSSDRMPDLPSTGAQRVERIDERSLRLRVDVDRPLPATAEEIDDARYSDATAMVDAEDPEIIALTERATASVGPDPMARARAIEVFVASYVRDKSLDVGFATASEVCRTREGDCSEHAALVTAMLRADGIPARAVSGLVYVDQFVGERSVFGYHMWAQALLDVDGVPSWVDLDAAVRPMDATHIAISTTDLGDATVNSMVTLATIMGRLSIDVESVE
ncbi:MAG: transglutaminase-like domain-containing protein [Planctomycetota bacterium]